MCLTRRIWWIWLHEFVSCRLDCTIEFCNLEMDTLREWQSCDKLRNTRRSQGVREREIEMSNWICKKRKTYLFPFRDMDKQTKSTMGLLVFAFGANRGFISWKYASKYCATSCYCYRWLCLSSSNWTAHTHTRICIYIVFVGQSLIDFAEGRTHAAYAQYLPFGTCEPNEAGKINK